MSEPRRRQPEPSPWYARAGPDLCQDLDTDARKGLSPEAARERREREGPNEIPSPELPSLWSRLVDQVKDPLVLALLVAAGVAAAVATMEAEADPSLLRYADTCAILAIVALNATLGVFQERKAEQALEALKALAVPHTRVVRRGEEQELEARDLVRGDLIRLEAGDAVPADLRILESAQLEVEESALTGESTPVSKDAGAEVEAGTPLPERSTALYMGTRLMRGTATGVVAATGKDTELGRIGALVSSVETLRTPLQERLDDFGTRILALCVVASALLFAIGIAQGNRPWPEMLLTAVSLAVAAIPEGLPAVTSVTLALGVRRMADRGAVIRQLPAVETLGSATVICTDKTGTLTKNALVVEVVETADGTHRVVGEGFSPEGGVLDEQGERLEELPASLAELVDAGYRCNHAELLLDEEGAWRPSGDPTEAALVALARRAGWAPRSQEEGGGEVVLEVPFDSARKRMCVVVQTPEGLRVAHVKGSPESVLERCRTERTTEGTRELDDARREALGERADALAGEGYRVLALARREVEEDLEGLDEEALEDGLVWLGMVGIRDQPREGVTAAIEECHAAGIRVVMITGDHARTARAIAEELGLWREQGLVVEGRELEEMDEATLDEALPRIAVFARVSPDQKLDIVRAFRRAGEVVAMTGDGVNDAPALREAHIGIAMGRGGTDVAREAAEMVLLDDDFTTIVAAVEEGRVLMENIRRFVIFLLGANAGLVLAVLASSTVPWLATLSPLQLLWINLVTNGLPALALGMEPGDESVLERAPQDPRRGLLDREHLGGIAVAGLVMGMAGLFAAALPTLWPGLLPGMDEGEVTSHSRTLAFMVLAFSPLIHAFDCRRLRASLLSTGLLGNRWLLLAVATSAILQLATDLLPGAPLVFETVRLDPSEWAWVAALSLTVVPAMELHKVLVRAAHRAA